jgi:hypothetical protein
MHWNSGGTRQAYYIMPVFPFPNISYLTCPLLRCVINPPTRETLTLANEGPACQRPEGPEIFSFGPLNL